MTDIRPTVVLLETIHEGGIKKLRQHAEVIELRGPGDPRAASACAAADAIIVRSTKYGSAEFAASPRVRVIGRHGAGTDNIDLALAKSRGVAVVNTPRSNTESVAEYVITVMLWELKRLGDGNKELASGTMIPEKGSLPAQVVRRGLVGKEIQGRTLGLVGLGAIGRAVAWRAQALGMKVRAFDPYVSDDEFVSLGVEPMLFEQVLSSSEIVSLHIPGRADGSRLLGEKEFALMRPGTLLVNAARGSLIEDKALVAAVESGLITAAIDVFDPEPPAPDSPLLNTPGILATPHQAAMTAEALERMSLDVVTAVIEALGLPT